MKIWLSARDWIDILAVSCGPLLIDISFFSFTFSMDCTFIRSSALISSSPTIQCDIQQKKILSLFYRVLLSFRPCQEYFSLVVFPGVDALDSVMGLGLWLFLFFLSTELFLLCILLQCTISAFRYDIIIVPA